MATVIHCAVPGSEKVRVKTEPSLTVAGSQLLFEPDLAVTESEIQILTSLISKSEVITPGDPSYEAESNTWSTSRNLHPKVVVRPATVQSVSRVLKFLGQSSLDFDVRNSGSGGASAKHVVISTRALTDFDFDRVNEILTIGAGSLWSEYYEQMEKAAPEYSVVAAATPFIGVGGSILAAGFSLMSKEYGCTSDPENMLDAQVVKLDGSVVWASAEPDLLWGLRGAYIGVGVVTKFKLRARKYPQSIWGGHIIIPKNKDREIAHGIAAMDSRDVDPRVFALLVPLKEVIIVNAYDALGEEHGRKTFAWALNIEGAMDTTRVTNLRGFASMQAPAELGKGIRQVWWNPLAIGRLTEELLLKSFQWGNRTESSDGNIMFELFGVRGSSSGPSGSAWPRPSSTRHFLMLSVGCAPDASPDDVARSRRVIQDGPKEILGKDFDERLIATSALDDYHNIPAIYGENWDRIVALKRKYDPKNKLHRQPLSQQALL